jgi:hypothetical protein
MLTFDGHCNFFFFSSFEHFGGLRLRFNMGSFYGVFTSFGIFLFLILFLGFWSFLMVWAAIYHFEIMVFSWLRAS